MQTDLKVIEDRRPFRLPDLDTPVRRRPACLFLNPVELRDARDRLVGNGRTLGPMNINELASHMSHAGDLTNVAGTIDVLEPGIAVCMHPAPVS